MSEFARSAVLHRVEAHATPNTIVAEDLATLGLRLGELDGALRELSGRISRVLGRPSHSRDDTAPEDC